MSESLPPSQSELGATWARWIGAAGGAGFLKPAPGTWGSLLTVAILALVSWIAPWNLQWIALTLAVLATIVGLVVYKPAMGSSHDPGWYVIDEVAGQALLIACVPAMPDAIQSWEDLSWLAAAFALFRLFDITKPWPVGALERLPGAWGVMLDDLAAGLLGACLLLSFTIG